MPIINGNVVDQNGVPVSGAQVYVYGANGSLEALTNVGGDPLDNPVVTGEDGYWEAYVALDGFYTIKHYWGGRLRQTEANKLAGDNPVSADDLATVLADIAAVPAQVTAAQEAQTGAELAQAGAESARDEALQYGAMAVYATWAAASAATFAAGDFAAVIASDTGTHTDPVVGGTVANAGYYRYSASPAGLERVGDLESQLTDADRLAAAASAAALGALIGPGKNLFNSADPDIDLGKYILWSNGTEQVNASFNATGFIPVTAGTTYTRSAGGQMAWYDSAKAYLNGVSTSELQVTAPPSAAYARTSVPTGSWSTFQWEVGAEATAYEAYTLKINPAKLWNIGSSNLAIAGVLLQNLAAARPGKNLADPSKFVADKYILSTNGTEQSNSTFNATGFIPVTAGEEYSLSYKSQLAWYTAAKTYISGDASSDRQVTAPANAAYCRASVTDAELAKFQFEAGNECTPYEPYQLGFDTAQLQYELRAARINQALSANGALRLSRYQREKLRRTHMILRRRQRGLSGQAIFNVGLDSWTHYVHTWCKPVLDTLVAKYGDAGGGVCSFGFKNYAPTPPPFTTSNQPGYLNGNARPATYPTRIYGSPTNAYGTKSTLDASSIKLHAATDYVTQAFPANPVHNACQLHFVGSADGVISYEWGVYDGTGDIALEANYAFGAATNLNVQGTVGATQVVDLAGIPVPGDGQTYFMLRIKRVSGTPEINLVDLKSAADGVRFNKVALTGQQVADFVNANAADYQTAVAATGATTLIIVEGTNSQGAQVLPEKWGELIGTLIDRNRAAIPGIDVLLAPPCENVRSGGNTIKMKWYQAKGYDVALAKGAAYMNFQFRAGDPDNPAEYGPASAFPILNNTDIHLHDDWGANAWQVDMLGMIEP